MTPMNEPNLMSMAVWLRDTRSKAVKSPHDRHSTPSSRWTTLEDRGLRG